MNNPYCTKPCSVTLHKLSSEFISDALNGRIKWKGLFKGRGAKNQLDLESYVRKKLAAKGNSYEIRKPSPEPSPEDSEHSNDGTICDGDDDEEYTTPVRQLRVRKPKKLLKCKDCNFTTAEPDNLLLHSAAHKSNCEECNLTFENKFKYQLHVYETHNPPVELKNHIVYGCKVCQHFFDIEEDAHNHLASHADIVEGGKYACALCRATYAKENSLTTHLSSKHIFYKCTFCEFLGSSFDILERHSLNTHAAYGKPYPCSLCDFRSSNFGALGLHRKTNHALLADPQGERCRLCYILIEPDREAILEHLISHVDCCLISCTSCDFMCNSFQLMRNHGLDFHGTQDLDAFAQLIDLNILNKAIKGSLDAHFGTASNKKSARTKPTFTETNMAIAGLNSSGFMGLDPIIDSPVKVIPMESSVLNIQGVMADQDPFLGGFAAPLDPMISFSSSANEAEINESLHHANSSFILQDLSKEQNHTISSEQAEEEDDEDHSDPQTSITVHPCCDPLGMAFDSAVNQPQVPIPSEGILSVDPETGQLYLQGLPVYDEKGQAIYVAIHESAQPSHDGDSPSKNIKDVQTVIEESAEPVPMEKMLNT